MDHTSYIFSLFFLIYIFLYVLASEGATILINGSLKEFDIDYDMLLSDVLDHYRTFQMLERLLHYPKRLTEQWIFQIAPSVQRMLIER